MKARIFRDGRGKALASVVETNEPNLVPLDVESDDGDQGELVEMSVRSRDLFDLDSLHKKMSK